MNVYSAASLLLILGGTACDPTDTSGDTTTDTLEDTGPKVYTGFDGELNYRTTFADEGGCDVRIGLTGTPFTGECETCDFAFDIDAEILEDNSDGPCYLNPLYSWLDGSYYHHYEYVITERSMGYIETYEMSDGDALEQLFLSGGTWTVLDGDQTYTLPYAYWSIVSYAGSNYGAFARTDDDIDWSFFMFDQEASRTNYLDVYNQCIVQFETEPLTEATFTTTDALGCDPALSDVWTVQADAGELVTMTVDTIADETAFDPALWVNDTANDACILAYSDDTAPCTFPPPEYDCPSLQVESNGGPLEVIVASFGDCAGDTAEYQLLVEAAGTLEVTLVVDDALGAVTGASETDILGSGTLLWE